MNVAKIIVVHIKRAISENLDQVVDVGVRLNASDEVSLHWPESEADIISIWVGDHQICVRNGDHPQNIQRLDLSIVNPSDVAATIARHVITLWKAKNELQLSLSALEGV